MEERHRKVLRHDLRSPLAVIAGRADLLLEGVAGELTEDQRRSVTAIAQAAERLRAELDQLAEELDPVEPFGGERAGAANDADDGTGS